MFDFRVSTHSHFDDACRAFALKHNIIQLANKAGLNPQTIRNKLNPEQVHQLTGESSTTKVSGTNSYAKLTINGEVLYECDLVNMIEIVGGTDLMEAHRNALGL